MALRGGPSLRQRLPRLGRDACSVDVYLSFSYRDVLVNSYFFEHFADDDVISLRADQKTDVWCVAKVERFLGELSGFVSVIPRRVTDIDAAGYSPYIGQ